jgi:hypothetical protein
LFLIRHWSQWACPRICVGYMSNLPDVRSQWDASCLHQWLTTLEKINNRKTSPCLLPSSIAVKQYY